MSLPPPQADWNDMEPGQIAWHVAPAPGGWKVTRVYGAEALLPDSDRASDDQ